MVYDESAMFLSSGVFDRIFCRRNQVIAQLVLCLETKPCLALRESLCDLYAVKNEEVNKIISYS